MLTFFLPQPTFNINKDRRALKHGTDFLFTIVHDAQGMKILNPILR